MSGRELGDLANYRLQVGDRFTVVAELHDLETLVRREVVPSNSSVIVEACPQIARESLVGLVRVKRNCTTEEAEVVVGGCPFALARN